MGYGSLLVMGLLALAAAGPAAAEVSWRAPDDGGTPRDAGRITLDARGEWTVRAHGEEGSVPLKHAVSRLDLLCHNDAAQPVTVTLHAELSDDGQRTLYDERPGGDMPRRDFVYIQAPGQPWRRVTGRTDRWTCTVAFEAVPGDTKVGLSPWYTYADYLAYLAGLPTHPHLRRELVGRSDDGREHWELTITDPAVPDTAKKRVFWHAREHGYETFSSFAMEGLVAWLLSDEAAAARRAYLFTLHPMTNVDGVARGNEYRAGYDWPNTRATASGRLTLAAIDRLKPEFVITWHNWIGPRDVDSLFFTDGDDHGPTRRAWDLFTQRFPSPRAAGHRWQSESQPNERNWHQRPLDEANPHMAAMKKYGSRVWGWEMPWWGRDDPDPAAAARSLGAAFGRAWVATQAELAAGHGGDPQPAAAFSVPRWQRHEFRLSGAAQVANPWRDASLVGEFTAPSGRLVSVEGFHDGGEAWRLRFVPDELGRWRYRLRGEGVLLSQVGEFDCVAEGQGRGFVGIHPEQPTAFAQRDGSAFFPMGDTCYGLYDDSHITPELRVDYLRTRRAQGFDFVRMSVGHSEQRAGADPAYWAWGGTLAKPDLDRLNPAFFAGLDALFEQMRAAGMNVELLMLSFYRRPFTDTRLWTPARERLWLRHLVARYASFDNLFLWTLANEYETHPDGRYRLDVPGDLDWVKATSAVIKQLDPYHHLVTVHPVISSSRLGESTRAGFAPPWRIGGFFGREPGIDVLSQQTASAYPTTWDEAQQCWVGDSPGVGQSIAADLVYGKPVLNTEFGYVRQPGRATGRQQVHHPDKVRRSAWRIVCSGGYFAAGFAATTGQGDSWERLDAPNRYPFEVADGGAGDALAHLARFFGELAWWRLKPSALAAGDGLALAEAGVAYVVYLPHGGHVKLELAGPAGAYAAQWFNPRTGVPQPAFEAAPGALDQTAPDDEDWVLRVVRR